MKRCSELRSVDLNGAFRDMEPAVVVAGSQSSAATCMAGGWSGIGGAIHGATLEAQAGGLILAIIDHFLKQKPLHRG